MDNDRIAEIRKKHECCVSGYDTRELLKEIPYLLDAAISNSKS